MTTDAHRALVDRLEESAELSWGGRTLLACLRRLRDGGLTEWQSISVESAWVIEEGFCVVYRWPGGPLVGLRVTTRSGSQPGMAAQEFGEEVADFSIAEPLGAITLTTDFEDVGWWGEPPFPDSRAVDRTG